MKIIIVTHNTATNMTSWDPKCISNIVEVVLLWFALVFNNKLRHIGTFEKVGKQFVVLVQRK